MGIVACASPFCGVGPGGRGHGPTTRDTGRPMEKQIRVKGSFQVHQLRSCGRLCTRRSPELAPIGAVHRARCSFRASWAVPLGSLGARDVCSRIRSCLHVSDSLSSSPSGSSCRTRRDNEQRPGVPCGRACDGDWWATPYANPHLLGVFARQNVHDHRAQTPRSSPTLRRGGGSSIDHLSS